MTPYSLTMPDGTVQIMYLVDGADLEEALGKHCAISKKGTPINPRPVSWRQIALTEIPQERRYRNAWRDTGATIEHDMGHAREIHMDHIRKARNRAIVELDVPFMRALEKGDMKEQRDIGARKQALRDLPQTFDLSSARTVDELPWPEDLPRG